MSEVSENSSASPVTQPGSTYGEVAKPPASRAPMARRAARRFLRFDFLAEPSSRGIGRLPVYAQQCDDGVLWAANDAPVVMR